MSKIRGKYILVFLIQLIVFAGSYIWLADWAADRSEFAGEMSGIGYIAKHIKNSDEPEEKVSIHDVLTKGKSERKRMITDKTFDFENKTVWLNVGQEDLYLGYATVCVFASLIFLSFGIGKNYYYMRKGIAIASGFIWSLLGVVVPIAIAIPVLAPFAILGLVFPIVIAVMVWLYAFFYTLLFLPISLIYYLVAGIVQMLKGKRRQAELEMC